MILTPPSVQELADLIRNAPERVKGVDLSQLRSIVEHSPEDMTATVQTGITLIEFQRHLAKFGQWVPIDPPGTPDLTVAELIATDLSGPRRLGYGTIREYIIGMQVVLGGGEIIRNGGKVVKNVAGYDLCRLFIGARHSLGIVVEVTFKLRPLPEKEVILQFECASLQQLAGAAEQLQSLDPIIMDAHNLRRVFTLVSSFAGILEDVDGKVSKARSIGFREAAYSDPLLELSPNPHKASLLPSAVWDYLAQLGEARFVARLGNGVVYTHHAFHKTTGNLPHALFARLKKAYDPRDILPELVL